MFNTFLCECPSLISTCKFDSGQPYIVCDRQVQGSKWAMLHEIIGVGYESRSEAHCPSYWFCTMGRSVACVRRDPNRTRNTIFSTFCTFSRACAVWVYEVIGKVQKLLSEQTNLYARKTTPGLIIALPAKLICLYLKI